ncbi:unnamed protein product [Adineta steineri]|uniref:Uncharacterized protein n=1 Tax=Adineta steineri TaxID=433720 RepID=A0A819L5T4_9BILA|nr:unnamed protein product [Adineta steineri]CAF3957188.1 unnamed protein product [Adineta steineri]
MKARAGADKKNAQPVPVGVNLQRRLSQAHRGSLTGYDDQEGGNMPANFIDDSNMLGRPEDQLKLTDAVFCF